MQIFDFFLSVYKFFCIVILWKSICASLKPAPFVLRVCINGLVDMFGHKAAVKERERRV